MTGSFVTYHIFKTGLWHFGYFANFFHKTKFLTIPIYFGGMFYAYTKLIKEIKSTGIEDYVRKRSSFNFDTKLIQKVCKTREDCLKEFTRETTPEVNI